MASAVLALVLSGCRSLPERHAMPTSERPVVSVVNGQIVVDPEPLTFRPHQRNVMIVWRLNDPSFSFDGARGITIDGEFTPGRPLDTGQTQVVNCRPGPDARQFTCLNKNEQAGKTYKYTVRLVGPNGRVERDPFIVNGL
jgi:hypothetical protein